MARMLWILTLALLLCGVLLSGYMMVTPNGSLVQGGVMMVLDCVYGIYVAREMTTEWSVVRRYRPRPSARHERGRLTRKKNICAFERFSLPDPES